MAVMKPTGSMMLIRSIFRSKLHPQFCESVRYAATKAGEGKKSPTRLAEVQRLLYQAEERYKADGVEPVPKISLVETTSGEKRVGSKLWDHVTISYANSGGGGPNVKSVSTKVDMRFNVKRANWLSERVRERIMQMEKHRINKNGEIVITSSKSRAQKNNTEDALAKLQVFNYQKKKLQEIIDAASYVPPPPSVETAKKISMLSALAEQKQLNKKKAESRKKVL